MHYENKELLEMGMEIGHNVKIHKKVEIINPSKIKVGNNVRIDCNSVISAGDSGIIFKGNNHIACGVCIFGSGGLVLLNRFASISAYSLIYSATENYTGAGLNPTTPNEFRDIYSGDVTLEDHVIIGAHSIILPNVKISKGTNIGSLSLVKNNIQEEFALYAGIPAKKIGERSREVLLTAEKYFTTY